MNGLELISIAFSKHLSVGMAFLEDQLDGDVIEKILKICIQKMDDEDTEVRCSAIKVIESITNKAHEGEWLSDKLGYFVMSDNYNYENIDISKIIRIESYFFLNLIKL